MSTSLRGRKPLRIPAKHVKVNLGGGAFLLFHLNEKGDLILNEKKQLQCELYEDPNTANREMMSAFLQGANNVRDRGTEELDQAESTLAMSNFDNFERLCNFENTEHFDFDGNLLFDENTDQSGVGGNTEKKKNNTPNLIEGVNFNYDPDVGDLYCVQRGNDCLAIPNGDEV